MTTPETIPPIATPRVAAGALFFDDQGRILLVKPRYKEGWEIPGGYVEPGESPRAACLREIKEEVGLSATVASHLVVDWAPAEDEGDKILFIFDAGHLTTHDLDSIRFVDGELVDWRLVSPREIDQYLIARLARRVEAALHAKKTGTPFYAEHGRIQST